MNKTVHKIYISSFFVVGIAVTLLLIINGLEYYQIPLEERFFHQDHGQLKPSGAWGHGLGIIGTLMITLGVSSYMIRKRNRKLFSLGYLKHWLEFHIFLCSVGPVLVLFHTAFKFGGIVSVSFWSMIVVVLSGIIGRFIYIQIPRTIQGKEVDIMELTSIRHEMSQNLYVDLTMNPLLFREFENLTALERYKSSGISEGIRIIFADFFRVRNFIRKLNNQLKHAGVSRYRRKEIIRTAKTEMILSRKIGLLKTMQKLFHYWHIAHLPFAITMFVIMLIHVAVTILFGYKWIF